MGFEIIDIRRFELKDFNGLLAAESRAWERTLRWDFAASTRVITACLRDKRLSGYALVEDGAIRGYCFFFYDGDKGIIGDLFVDPDISGVERQRELLEHALETLLATPGLRRIEAQLPHYERAELESCFQTHRFQGFLRRFMTLMLASRKKAPATLPAQLPAAKQQWLQDNIQIIPWEKRFHDAAADMLYQSYRRHVDARINDQYSSVIGATRLIENIFYHQGCGDFLEKVSRMALHRPTQALAGILAITHVLARTAHIPQVGVGPQFQKYGVGTALMEAAFQDLAQEGYEQVTLTVTDANSGAVRLYQRLGFETYKTFGAYICLVDGAA